MGDLEDDLIWNDQSKCGKRFYTLSSPNVPQVNDAAYTYAWTKSIGDEAYGVLLPIATWKELIGGSKSWTQNSNASVSGRNFAGRFVGVQTSRAGKRPQSTDFDQYFQDGQEGQDDEVVRKKLHDRG